MKKIISLDIGGTNFRAALINEKYEIEKRSNAASQKNSIDSFLKQAKEVITPLFSQDVIGISMGVPGRVRSDGYIYALPNMNINNIDLIGYLKKLFNVPVYIKNDAEMAVLGEKSLGSGKDLDSLYFVTISTGLGGAMAIKNSIVASSTEIGHTLIMYKGKLEEYEKLLSGTGVIRLAKLNGLKVNSSRSLFALIQGKNDKAMVVYKEWLTLMSQFLNFINDSFEPKLIALTGGVMKSKDVFFDDLIKKTKLPLVECKLGQDAGLIGSAFYGFNI